MRSSRGGRQSSQSSGPGLIYALFYRRKVEEKRLEKRKEDSMLTFYRDVWKRTKNREKVPQPPKQVLDALRYLRWDVDPRAIVAAARTASMYLLLLGLLLSGLILYTTDALGYFAFWDPLWTPDLLLEALGDMGVVFALFLPILLYAAGYYFFLYYPVSAADAILRGTVVEMPRLVGYLVMSMRLVPNLEKAVEFASRHGGGVLTEELREILWNVQLGMYESIESAIDQFAYKWGEKLEELKHALMRIRASVMEADDAKRFVLLDSALSEVVQGAKERMLDEANKLYMPSMQLFYVGVFLPLLLFIVFPVGAAFSGSDLGSVWVMAPLYNVFLPLVVFMFARSVIGRRPPIYTNPQIPDRLVKDYNAKKRRALLYSLAVFSLLLALGYVLHLGLDWTLERIAVEYCGSPDCLAGMDQEKLDYILSQYDMTPYWLIYGGFLAFAAAVAVYLFIITRDKLEIQKNVMRMEDEFKDAVYVLASRMGEGKPLETALDAVNEMMPGSSIARLFQRIAYNVKTMGLTLEDAVFNPIFGALRDVPSDVLQRAFRLVVHAVSLGTELAAKALLTFSEQLRNEFMIKRAIREKLAEIATMMNAMAFLVAPVVLGITVALEQVIVASLIGMGGTEVEIPEEVSTQLGFAVPKMQAATANIASPAEFLVIVGVYVLEITALLVYFSTYLQEGPDRLRLLRNLAIALPVATLLFVLSSWGSLSLVQGMMGG